MVQLFSRLKRGGEECLDSTVLKNNILKYDIFMPTKSSRSKYILKMFIFNYTFERNKESLG